MFSIQHAIFEIFKDCWTLSNDHVSHCYQSNKISNFCDNLVGSCLTNTFYTIRLHLLLPTRWMTHHHTHRWNISIFVWMALVITMETHKITQYLSIYIVTITTECTTWIFLYTPINLKCDWELYVRELFEYPIHNSFFPHFSTIYEFS